MVKPSLFANKNNSISSSAPPVKGYSRDFRIVLALTLVHLPLGVALYNVGPAKIIHPLLVFAFGLYLALKKEVGMESIALVVAYIIGAEVLWRMASVPVLWEFGKVSSIILMGAALVRRHRYDIPKPPLIYLLLLVPACLIAFTEVDLSVAIDRMSLNMTGPVLLMVSCWFFYNAKISPLQFRRLLIAFILPLLSVGMSALFYTVTAEDLTFTGESNFTTSGGFGPNQVSAMLGLGVFVSGAGILLFKKRSVFSIFFAVSALIFTTLCVMTFSRGGMYNAVGGILVLLIFGLQDVVSGLRRLIPALVLGGLFLFFIYPLLDDFTGGQLQERFEDTGTTQRAEIAESDLAIFFENPVFGIGVGSAYNYRVRFLEHKAISHTEFSRMVSEHGAFGLAALMCMVVMLIGNLKRPNSVPGRAFVAGAMAWSAFFMLNTGMRLAAPSFLWGLSFITIVSFRRTATSVSNKLRTGSVRLVGTRQPRALKQSTSF